MPLCARGGSCPVSAAPRNGDAEAHGGRVGRVAIRTTYFCALRTCSLRRCSGVNDWSLIFVPFSSALKALKVNFMMVDQPGNASSCSGCRKRARNVSHRRTVRGIDSSFWRDEVTAELGRSGLRCRRLTSATAIDCITEDLPWHRGGYGWLKKRTEQACTSIRLSGSHRLPGRTGPTVSGIISPHQC